MFRNSLSPDVLFAKRIKKKKEILQTMSNASMLFVSREISCELTMQTLCKHKTNEKQQKIPRKKNYEIANYSYLNV